MTVTDGLAVATVPEIGTLVAVGVTVAVPVGAADAPAATTGVWLAVAEAATLDKAVVVAVGTASRVVVPDGVTVNFSATPNGADICRANAHIQKETAPIANDLFNMYCISCVPSTPTPPAASVRNTEISHGAERQHGASESSFRF
ncbi:MAG TPA: hypothetical protein VHS28_01025 [Chloroflexota bacterium]|nr:hypothetical protein [Chloroflexota bacterium]